MLHFPLYIVPSDHPRNINAMALNSKTLFLTWGPPKLEEQNSNIVKYGLNLTELETGKFMQFFTQDSTTSVTIEDLHPHYNYNFSVTAFTSVGNGPYSPTHIIQMPQDGKLLGEQERTQVACMN